MRQKLYIGIILIYILLGIVGLVVFYQNSYIDNYGWKAYMENYLVIGIVLSAIVGFTVFFLFKKLFPEKYAQRRNKVGWVYDYIFPILMAMFAFILNSAIPLPFNALLGYDKKIEVHGVIMNNIINHQGNRGGTTYFLSISDTVTNEHYYFRVKKNVSLKYQPHDTINKEFYLGKLGIIYRKEE